MARLSLAYLHRFPESLRFHSMQTYTYNGVTQHNRNRLLGHCPGVDGLKTGWIAASGYNLLATAKRGDTRVLVVVLGAPNPAARLVETRKLLEVAYQKLATGSPVIELADLSCYVDPYGPPPGKKQPHGKPKKMAAAKKSQHQAGKKSATSTGKTKLAKNKSQQAAKTLVAKQDKAHQISNQSSKGKPTKTKQQASVQQATGKQQPAQGAKLSTKSTASNCAPKNVKKTDSHQTAAKPQKTNGKSRDKTADSKKKAKPQAKKSSSEHT
jgi:D-alanyl-D-alanine carboxypeptidase